MGWIWAIIIGAVGICIGVLLPAVAKRIAAYKLSQRNRQLETHRQDRWLVKQGAGLFVGLSSGIYAYFSDNALLIGFSIVLIGIATVFALIDWRIRIIPNEMVIITLVLGTLYQFAGYGLKSLGLALICMMGMLTLFVILGLIVGLQKIGAGDVKLVAVMGLILGYPNIVAGILAMSIALLIYLLVGMVAGKLTHVSMFPYAPFITLGIVSGLLYGVIL